MGPTYPRRKTAAASLISLVRNRPIGRGKVTCPRPHSDLRAGLLAPQTYGCTSEEESVRSVTPECPDLIQSPLCTPPTPPPEACLVERRPHSCPSTAFCAVLQGSLFGQLGTMPSTYSTLFLSGQGLAGIFAALAMLMSMASGVDAQTSALGYFITPCVGILMSIVCYLSLPHLEFARYYLAKEPSKAQGQELETKAELLHSDEKDGIPNSPLTLDLDSEKEPELEPEELQQPGKPSVFVVFRKIWLTALCLVLVFTVTLSVFPAITAMVTSSTSPGKWSQFFNPVCCFLLFNVMDWLGRSLTSYFLRTRTAGCCPCWSACVSCLCRSSCCATCPRGPGCPSSSHRTPISSLSCCSLPFPMVT
nr:PREDICTED: equilibrative nucleoside transporter 2 isoform X3 [Equus przewalskii]